MAGIVLIKLQNGTCEKVGSYGTDSVKKGGSLGTDSVEKGGSLGTAPAEKKGGGSFL